MFSNEAAIINKFSETIWKSEENKLVSITINGLSYFLNTTSVRSITVKSLSSLNNKTNRGTLR